jgi:hypothetical protein
MPGMRPNPFVDPFDKLRANGFGQRPSAYSDRL